MKSALAVLFCLSFVPCRAAADDSQIYVRKLEAAYRTSRTLQAAFLQEYSESGRVTRAESGTAYFRRPGKMRWEYASPEKNLFVVDGKSAWFYAPADRTVSRVAVKDSADWRTPLALLAGEMRVSRVCAKVSLAAQQPKDSSFAQLDCAIRGTEKEARARKPHDSAYFVVAKETGELAQVVVVGAGGVRMEMRFTHWRFNPPVEEALFHFQPPKGVTIVDGNSLMAGPETGLR